MTCSERPTDNLAKAMEKVREATGRGANIVCLQELFTSRYFCISETPSPFALAEPIPGPSIEALQSLAKELHTVIIAPVFEKRAEGVYHNAAAAIDADGSYLGKYRKMHVPDDPGWYEKWYFTPGDLGFKAFSTQFGRIGILICWDQWFPEAARLTAMAGAEILFYPTAIGKPQAEEWREYEAWIQAWQIIQRSHAIANGIPVVTVNRVGQEGPTQFWGASFVSDTFGEIIFEGSRTDEEVGVVELDLTRPKKVPTRAPVPYGPGHFPFFRDRRIDAYGDLTKIIVD